MKLIAVFLLLSSILLVACSSAGGTSSATPTLGLLPTLEPTTAPAPDNNTPLAPSTPAATAAPQAVTGVATDTLNVRAGPGLTFAVKGQLKAGDSVTIIGKSADGLWWQVSGGWVSATYVRVNGDATTVPVATPGP